MKMGRFVIDAHVHSQRHAAGSELKKKLAENPDGRKRLRYRDLAEVMPQVKAYDNSERLLYDMQCYDVDMCILMASYGMTNEQNLALVEKYPGKFAAICCAKETYDRAEHGETKWSIEEGCKELDNLLSTGKYCGIGELVPADPQVLYRKKQISKLERIDQLMQVWEVAGKHGVPVHYHTGFAMGYHLGIPETLDPLWAHELAANFPDVPIIFDHGGMACWWWEHLVDQCLHVAASHDNVYLETGLYWTDLYYKALLDPNVGPEKLLWATDWGASIPVYSQPGHKPPAYAMQLIKEGVVTYQVDMMGWSLRQLRRLDISQDDLNLILGGNAIRLYKLNFPLRRMFKPVEQ
jgi:predicted TIM-barrel fold metal-dependent hydrolase